MWEPPAQQHSITSHRTINLLLTLLDEKQTNKIKYLAITRGLRTPTVCKESTNWGELNILYRDRDRDRANKATPTVILPSYDVKYCLRNSIKAHDRQPVF